MSDHATTIASTTPPTKEFKVAEVRDDGTVILQMEDGRMFPAEAKDGVDVNKRSTVFITNEGEDKDGTPLNAKIARIKAASDGR